MVELEKVTTTDDKQLLHDLITKHFMYTGSRKAKAVLDSWKTMLPKFVKVMPIDYKRVLAERKAATAKSGKSVKREAEASSVQRRNGNDE